MANRTVKNTKLQTMQVLDINEETGTFVSSRLRSPYPTPWGATQRAFTYTRGVHFVTTARHGGFLVSKRWAERNLSDAARNQAIFFNNYFCFEEDVLASIVLLESTDLRRLNAIAQGTGILSEEELINTINLTNPGYLVSRGVTAGERTVTQHAIS